MICPQCQGELITINDNELYCPKDDFTLKLSKGRLVAQPDDPAKKGKLRELEETIAENTFEIQKLKDFLGGTGKKVEFWE